MGIVPVFVSTPQVPNHPLTESSFCQPTFPQKNMWLWHMVNFGSVCCCFCYRKPQKRHPEYQFDRFWEFWFLLPKFFNHKWKITTIFREKLNFSIIHFSKIRNFPASFSRHFPPIIFVPCHFCPDCTIGVSENFVFDATLSGYQNVARDPCLVASPHCGARLKGEGHTYGKFCWFFLEKLIEINRGKALVTPPK